MSIFKTLRKLLLILTIDFYKVKKSFGEIEKYDKYLVKKLQVKNVSLDKIVDGVLTISIPSDIKLKVSNIMLVSE